MSKAIYWGPCTINNPTEADRAAMASPPEWVRTVEGQDEVGAEGTPHIQFYVVCKAQQRMSALKKWLPRAHLEVARDIAAVKLYCTKKDTAVAESRFTLDRTRDFYVTPAAFPRWLRQKWDLLPSWDAEEENVYLPGRQRCVTPLQQASYAVAHVTAQGFDVAHLWAQASLRRVILELWDVFASSSAHEDPREMDARAYRYARNSDQRAGFGDEHLTREGWGQVLPPPP